MADQAIFIGWGETITGREQKAIEVFNDSVAYWGKLQGDGKIDGMDIVFLSPHGGDLAGFALLRGNQEQLDAVSGEDDFNMHLARASLVVRNLGAVRSAINEGIQQQMELFQNAINAVS